MKTLPASLMFVAPLLLLPGCASTQGAAYKNAAPESVVQDGQYVARVEHVAKQRGTRVVWVNPPVKRVPQVATAR